MSYNIHSLIHLVNNVNSSGHLDAFSAFKFENYLQQIKRSVRGHALPLEQLIRLIYEEREIIITRYTSSEIYPMLENPHFDGPLVMGASNPRFKNFKFKNFTVSLSEPDNCFLMKNTVIFIVDNIATVQNIVIIGRESSVWRMFLRNHTLQAVLKFPKRLICHRNCGVLML